MSRVQIALNMAEIWKIVRKHLTQKQIEAIKRDIDEHIERNVKKAQVRSLTDQLLGEEPQKATE